MVDVLNLKVKIKSEKDAVRLTFSGSLGEKVAHLLTDDEREKIEKAIGQICETVGVAIKESIEEEILESNMKEFEKEVVDYEEFKEKMDKMKTDEEKAEYLISLIRQSIKSALE